MNQAVHVKTLNGWKGDASLYRLMPAYVKVSKDSSSEHAPDIVETIEFVAVSAVFVDVSTNIFALFLDCENGDETYIFAADETGQVKDWEELPGSFKGGLDHVKALEGMGYTLVPPCLSSSQAEV